MGKLLFNCSNALLINAGGCWDHNYPAFEDEWSH